MIPPPCSKGPSHLVLFQHTRATLFFNLLRSLYLRKVFFFPFSSVLAIITLSHFFSAIHSLSPHCAPSILMFLPRLLQVFFVLKDLVICRYSFCNTRFPFSVSFLSFALSFFPYVGDPQRRSSPLYPTFAPSMPHPR